MHHSLTTGWWQRRPSTRFIAFINVLSLPLSPSPSISPSLSLSLPLPLYLLLSPSITPSLFLYISLSLPLYILLSPSIYPSLSPSPSFLFPLSLSLVSFMCGSIMICQKKLYFWIDDGLKLIFLWMQHNRIIGRCYQKKTGKKHEKTWLKKWMFFYSYLFAFSSILLNWIVLFSDLVSISEKSVNVLQQD